MAFDYEGAKKAGYTDAEIVDHLASQNKFDAAGARKSGYSDSELLKHLTTQKPAPAAPAAPQPQEASFLDKLGRSSALAGRSLLEGAESAVTFPVRAVAEAGAGIANLAGKKDVADYISRNLGMRGNAVSAMADYAGAPKPETGVEKTFAGANRMIGGMAAAGAPTIVSNVSRLFGNAPAVAAPVLGTTAAPTFSNTVRQAVTTPEGQKEILSNLIPTATSGGQLALAAGIGGAMEAAPEATLATVGGLAALKGGKMALGAIDDKLVANKVAKLDPTQAEIILDLTTLKGGNRKTVLNADKLNTLGGSYVDDAVLKLEEAGLMTPQLTNAVKNREVIATKPGLLALLQSTPEGEALYQAMSKDAALGMMTARQPALGGLFKLGRSGVDAGVVDAVTGFPLPRSFRDGAKSVLGPAEERYQKADQWISPRWQKAAKITLAENGPSEATKGLGILTKTADDLAASKAAQEADDLAADMASGRYVVEKKNKELAEAARIKEEKLAAKLAKDEEARMIREGGQILKERKAAEAAATPKPGVDPNLSISELQATDPTYLLGLSNPNGVPRNARQMDEFSDVMKAQLEAPVKAKQEALFGILNEVADANNVVRRSGPLQKLEEGFGLTPDSMKSILDDIATKNPKFKAVVDELYSPNGYVKDLTLLSDTISTITGKTFNKNPQGNIGQGALSLGEGALKDASGANIKSPNLYKAGEERFRANYTKDREMIANDPSITGSFRNSLDRLYDILENTGRPEKRNDAIEAIIKQYPEKADFISQLMGKY